jgi:hypothetical protein
MAAGAGTGLGLWRPRTAICLPLILSAIDAQAPSWGGGQCRGHGPAALSPAPARLFGDREPLPVAPHPVRPEALK